MRAVPLPPSSREDAPFSPVTILPPSPVNVALPVEAMEVSDPLPEAGVLVGTTPFARDETAPLLAKGSTCDTWTIVCPMAGVFKSKQPTAVIKQ